MEDNTKLYWHDLESLGLTKDQLKLINEYKKLNNFSSVDDLVKHALIHAATSHKGVFQDVIHLLSLALRYPDQTKTLVTAALEVLQS